MKHVKIILLQTIIHVNNAINFYHFAYLVKIQ